MTADDFRPDWDMLAATQDSLREHMQLLRSALDEIARLQLENTALHAALDAALKNGWRYMTAPDEGK